MQSLDYVVRSQEDGWQVAANGVECAILADRDTALLSAMRWANRRQSRGVVITVRSIDSQGDEQIEWMTGDPFPPLRFLAALMRRSSAVFVREWTEWNRDLYLSS